jgi:DNA-binding XRE family transcriptional regulator
MKNNIFKYRKWKGITQRDLADELGISLNTERYLELNKYKTIKPLLMRKICEYFNVSLDQMFYENKEE